MIVKLLLISVWLLSGCTYNMGHKAGVKLYKRTNGKTFVPANYDGGVVAGYMAEYERTTELKRETEKIIKQLESLRIYEK